MSSIWVGFLGADFADDVAIANFFEMIRRYVGKVNDMEGIGAIGWVFCRIVASETLAEMPSSLG